MPAQRHARSTRSLRVENQTHSNSAFGPRPTVAGPGVGCRIGAAIASFETCFGEALQAASRTEGTTRTQALALVLECGTETGDLEPALAAWRELESGGWQDPRRTWLGRRLGVALARSAVGRETIDGIASALPYHERCLHYWRAASQAETRDLADLADEWITDIYGRWARDTDESRFQSDPISCARTRRNG